MKILIVDDHALFREGLCHVLKGLEESVCILEAASYDSAFVVLEAHQDMDLMLLDLNIPGRDGFSILDAASKDYPTLPIAVLSASHNKADVERVMKTSAMGYIHKNTSSKVMLGAVRLILDGGVYTPPSSIFNVASSCDDQSLSAMTPRQREVFSLLVSGVSNKEIAIKLDIAEATIKMHVTAIFRALGVKNRTQAALFGGKTI